ncbi:MAG: DUF2312 domain-containing protein [Aestuariivita sp.]|nr:DUF2312 domain-containing protein [Aestuariivita sp.]
MTDDSTNFAHHVSADELRQIVQQYEEFEAQRIDIVNLQKDIMANAKANGYDTRVLRKLISLRKRDRDEVAQEEAILDAYKTALAMPSGSERDVG